MGRIHGWLAPGALVLSDQPLRLQPSWGLEPVDTSAEVAHAERYFVYARAG